MKRIVSIAMAAALLAPSLAWADDDEELRDDGDQAEVTSAPAEATATGAPTATDFPRRRYVFAGAGVFLLGGIGMSFLASGDATRSTLDIENARPMQQAVLDARTSAAGANLLYALAGVTLAYGLALELLPEQVADKADLTFHF